MKFSHLSFRACARAYKTCHWARVGRFKFGAGLQAAQIWVAR